MEKTKSEIRIYNPESNEGAWVPVMIAEMKINDDEYISVMAPAADKWWGYYVTDTSLIEFEEKDAALFEETNEHYDWDEFKPHIKEEYNCVKDLIEHKYLKEFLYVIADAVNEFGIEANFTE